MNARRTVVISVLALRTVLPSANAGAQARPGAWRQYATPEAAGFSSAALDSVRWIADSLRSGAVFVVYQGHVLAAWGDVARKLPLHSVRKSLTSALYGVAVASREIDLDATLGRLGIDDTTPLTRAEVGARVRDVIAARSGVYLPAAYAAADQDSSRPARGAHQPGTFWFYNNWDFNVAETIYARETGESVYAAFARRIAQPTGMEDLSEDDGFLAFEPELSRYPAHTWRMSARDLARFGQLYLQRGRWEGRQIIPAAWIRESTAPTSDLGGGRGYGYMWWTYTAGSYGASYPQLNKYASFAGTGTGGQAVIVIPEAKLVVVHRGDTDHNRHVAGRHVWSLVERVLAARRGPARTDPALAPLTPAAFVSQLPPLDRPAVASVPAGEVAALVGTYDFGGPEPIRVTRFRDRPFIYMPGRGQAELLRTGEWQYTIGIVPGVTIVATRGPGGAVTTLSTRIGTQQILGRRVSDSDTVTIEFGSVVGDLRVHRLTSRVFGNTRMLRVWIPPGYDALENRDRRYPVLYLNDGQNLFDSATAVLNPMEWRVDETIQALIAAGTIPPLIVVGIDNAGRRARFKEYFPWVDEYLRPPEPDPQGKRYPEFLVDEVLPFVNGRYRTLRDPDGTGLGGSSAGGLAALYAAIHRPDVFGRLLIESPSIYVNSAHILREAARLQRWPPRVYLGAGTNESSRPNCVASATAEPELVRDVRRLSRIIVASDTTSRVKVLVVPCAVHNEAAWGARLGEALQFLFGEAMR